MLEWVDPFVGLRVRHQLAPGKELQFLGDVGGFGVGSDLTWQLFGGYSFDFAVWQSTLHGVVGYRALAVDYSQDSGASKNKLDLILHGPVVGLSFRWYSPWPKDFVDQQAAIKGWNSRRHICQTSLVFAPRRRIATLEAPLR
jgi:hypothetical protein